MSVLFEISDRRSETSSNRSVNIEEAMSNDCENDEQEEDCDNHDWVQVKNVKFNSIEDQVYSYVGCVIFCLLNPLYLGFFPYHTEVSVLSTDVQDVGDGSST